MRETSAQTFMARLEVDFSEFSEALLHDPSAFGSLIYSSFLYPDFGWRKNAALGSLTSERFKRNGSPRLSGFSRHRVPCGLHSVSEGYAKLQKPKLPSDEDAAPRRDAMRPPPESIIRVCTAPITKAPIESPSLNLSQNPISDLPLKVVLMRKNQCQRFGSG